MWEQILEAIQVIYYFFEIRKRQVEFSVKKKSNPYLALAIYKLKIVSQ